MEGNGVSLHKPEETPSWSQLRGVVREAKRAVTGSTSANVKNPTNFAFRTFSDVLRTRIYFLSTYLGKESTLLYVDIDDTNWFKPSDAYLPWNSLIESTFQVIPSSGNQGTF